MFIRKVKNTAGNVAIQVIRKADKKNTVIKHIGTARTQLLPRKQKNWQTWQTLSGSLNWRSQEFQRQRIEIIVDEIISTLKKETGWQATEMSGESDPQPQFVF